MSKIFISYRRKSSAFTLLLANKLSERLDADIFVDFESIDQADFEQSILKHLHESDVFLLMVTEHTFADRIHMDSDWVRKEIRTALERKMPIVLVSENGLFPPHNIPDDIREIRNKQGIEFYPAYFDAAVTRLVKFLAKATDVHIKETQPTVQPLPVPQEQIDDVAIDQQEVSEANGRNILRDALSAYDDGDYAQALFLFEALIDIDYQTRVINIDETLTKVRELHDREERKRHAEVDYDEIALFASRISTRPQALREFAQWAEENAEFVDELDTENLRKLLREQQEAEHKRKEEAQRAKQATSQAKQQVKPSQTPSESKRIVEPNRPTPQTSNSFILLLITLCIVLIIVVAIGVNNGTIKLPDLPPELLALEGVTSNAEWENLVGEGGYVRDFNGTEMVLVPVGEFEMGDPNGEGDETPHMQQVTEPFWIDKYEVTNADFAQFLNEQGNQNADGFLYLENDYEEANNRIQDNSNTWQVSDDYANNPVVEVTWFGARDYCAWREGRLPTELEWEYAASGVDNLVYPWGDEWNANNAIFDTDDTFPVGTMDAGQSWVGAYDMSGNVWEWVSSLYLDYRYDVDHENARNFTDDRVLRGGAWYFNDALFLRVAKRGLANPAETNSGFGFRCARDYE